MSVKKKMFLKIEVEGQTFSNLDRYVDPSIFIVYYTVSRTCTVHERNYFEFAVIVRHDQLVLPYNPV